MGHPFLSIDLQIRTVFIFVPAHPLTPISKQICAARHEWINAQNTLAILVSLNSGKAKHERFRLQWSIAGGSKEFNSRGWERKAERKLTPIVQGTWSLRIAVARNQSVLSPGLHLLPLLVLVICDRISFLSFVATHVLVICGTSRSCHLWLLLFLSFAAALILVLDQLMVGPET